MRIRSRIARLFFAAMFAIATCVGGMVASAPAQAAAPFWLIFGGNGDPGDGNGGGAFRHILTSQGWTTEDRVFQVTYPADVARMAASTEEAMGPGIDAYNRFCHVNNCIIAGFSLGTDPAIELSYRVGHPGNSTYVYGAPQPATGVWHHFFPNNPAVEPAFNAFGFPTWRVPKPGTHHFFHQDDVFANTAPQCADWPSIIYQSSAGFHIVIPPGAGVVWTGPDGVVNHEVDGPNPTTVSGRDPSPIWKGCPLNDWRTTI